jgi:hypothetical protein
LNKIDIINNTAIIVGDNATILKNENNIWLTIQCPVNTNLNDVTFKDSLNGFIAADFGYVLKTVDGGLTWNISLSGADVDFKKVIYHSDSLWTIGTNGVIYVSIDNGQIWERFCIGTFDNLNSMVYLNEKGFIVGSNGLLRKFNNHQYIPLIDQLYEVNNDHEIQSFPNPTSDNITLTCTQNFDANFSFNVVNIQGKTVFQTKKNASLPYTLDLSDLPNGIYFLNVTSDEKHKTFKVIKTR